MIGPDSAFLKSVVKLKLFNPPSKLKFRISSFISASIFNYNCFADPMRLNDNNTFMANHGSIKPILSFELMEGITGGLKIFKGMRIPAGLNQRRRGIRIGDSITRWRESLFGWNRQRFRTGSLWAGNQREGGVGPVGRIIEIILFFGEIQWFRRGWNNL